MPRTTFGNLSRKRATPRKRRTSTLVKAKYKPRTTTANRSLIKSNAYAIKALRRMIPNPIWTDYQLGGALGPFVSGAPEPYANLTQAQLMSPSQWTACLRQDSNVAESAATRILRMQLNLRYSLGESNWCQITTFVVSIRKDAANRVINEQGLINGQDYIVSPTQSFNARLNPAVFKVHYVRNVSLMSNTWLEPSAQAGNSTFASNSYATFKKGQVNMKLGFNIRQPLGEPWTALNQAQLSPSQRLFLISFFRGQTDGVDDNPPRVDFDALYTAYNSS